MNSLKKRYKVKLEVCGPVHIGSKERLLSNDYIYDPELNKVYILDNRKFFRYLNKVGLLKEYENFIGQTISTDEVPDLKTWLQEKNITREELKPCILYNLSRQDVVKEGNQTKELFPFLKDAYGNPYVPGSSLRGVIRTALLQSELLSGKEKTITSILKSKWNMDFHTKDYEKELEELEWYGKRLEGKDNQTKETKHWIRKVDGLMSAIQVSESKPLSVNQLICCQKIDMLYERKPKKNSLDILFEALKPGTIIEFDLTIDMARICQLLGEEEEFDGKDILEALSVSYKYMQSIFVSKFNYLNFLNRKNHGKSIYLYLGGRTGYVSKSLTYSLLGYLDGMKITSRILHYKNLKDMEDAKEKNQKIGPHHHDSEDLVVAPHTLKCTKYHKKLYEIGLCKISLVE